MALLRWCVFCSRYYPSRVRRFERVEGGEAVQVARYMSQRRKSRVGPALEAQESTGKAVGLYARLWEVLVDKEVPYVGAGEE